MFHHLIQGGWRNLPGEAVLVFEPTALLSFWNCRELFPIVINLFLGDAMNQKGNGFIECKVMFVRAIHRREPLTLQHKIGKHDISFFIRLLPFPVPGYQAHLRILKYREVKIDGLFCTTSDTSHKHERRNNKWSLFSFWVGQNKLP